MRGRGASGSAPVHHAVVTGAAGGIGRALCLAVARRGGHIVAADIDLEGAEETARLAAEAGGSGTARRCDVTRPEEVEALAAFAFAEGPTPTLWVNNAGVVVAGGVGEVSLDDWKWIVDINLWGVVHGCHAVVPRFKDAGRGHILNVSSIAGVLCSPETAPYNATKAAVIALSETLSAELGPWDVHTTVLCPTAVRTSLFDRIRSADDVYAKVAKKSAAGSGRDPETIAEQTLEAVDRRALYVFPQPDGRAIWRAKRAAPAALTRVMREVRNRGLLERMVGRKPKHAG